MRPVLYAEDSEDDAFLMQRAFRELKAVIPLVIVPNGREAMAYLAATDDYANRQRNLLPALVLLDVKMPYADGLEVLSWIRAQSRFHDIPVFMLTSSSQRTDIVYAYANGANGYIVKPTDLETFNLTVEDLLAYCEKGSVALGWMTVRGGTPLPPPTDDAK
ncbi:MAG TPA: response regulator [Opitutaceae bacterium]|nr:response regulator [Opitutaceae bacterium]